MTRPPSDAIVALRSLDRRYREVFAEPDDATAADEVAHHNGADGRSPLDHVVAATRTLTFLGRALDQTLVEDDPILHPAVTDPTAREWPDGTGTGTVEERLSELAWEANALADRASRATASEWAREARAAGTDASVTAVSILWDAVDSAVAHLRAAERTLAAR